VAAASEQRHELLQEQVRGRCQPATPVVVEELELSGPPAPPLQKDRTPLTWVTDFQFLLVSWQSARTVPWLVMMMAVTSAWQPSRDLEVSSSFSYSYSASFDFAMRDSLKAYRAKMDTVSSLEKKASAGRTTDGDSEATHVRKSPSDCS
jgi:hypothetical protein